MRDIVLLTVLPFLLVAIFQRPFIGLGLWIWTALFFPNGWVYGIASSIRYNFLFAGLMIFVYIFSKEKSQWRFGSLGVIILVFFVWTTITTALGFALPEIAWESWSRFAKVIALFVFVVLILKKKLHIDFFLWCLIFSVGFFAGLEGLKYIASGGGHNIEGMSGHVLGDRNDLALALAMLLPICFYLIGEYGKKSWILKFGLLGLITLIVTAIVGTNSRGGLVALASVGSYLFIKSKRKILFAFLLICIGSAMVGLIPAEWFERMNSIEKADGDASFMGRVVAWKLSYILAMQNPLFGGGFKALEYFPVWSSLSKDFYSYPFFPTGTAVPDLYRGHAPHSIYFQVLGDHGFVGLFIFLSMIVIAFFQANFISKKILEINGPEWIANLAIMLRLSIFAYVTGGAALSFAYFDMIYAIYGLIIVLKFQILNPLLKDKVT